MSKTFAVIAACTLACAALYSEGQTPAAASPALPDAPSVRSTSPDQDLSIRGLPLRFLKDEVGVITSPARIRARDLVWLAPLAGASAAAFATDSYTMRKVVSHNASFNDAAATTSDGIRDAAIGVPVLLFAVGQIPGHEKEREAGMLAGEAILDSYALDAAVKYATLRERPNLNNADGHFFTRDAVSDPSFVSGHTVVAWSSAAVLTEEYSRPWQQVGIYTLASGVSLTRVLGQQHFPSDVLLGSAMGWLIGRYVYRTHHRERTGR